MAGDLLACCVYEGKHESRCDGGIFVVISCSVGSVGGVGGGGGNCGVVFSVVAASIGGISRGGGGIVTTFSCGVMFGWVGSGGSLTLCGDST